MWLVKSILLICSISYALSKTDLCQICGTVKISPRIFHGTASNYGPWVVYLESSKGSDIHFCSGTIIDFKHILTSSHCFLFVRDSSPKDKASSITIFAGDTVKMGRGSEILEPEAVYIHPSFVYKNGDVNSYDDIAIIKLKNPIEFSDKIKPACIFNNEDAKPEDYTTIQGYGFKDEFSNSNRLLEAILKVQSNEKCLRIYDNMFTPEHLCAKDEKDGLKGACPGDSGGPLIKMVKGRQNLVGISSFGGHCDGFPNSPVVFTRVNSYMKWIRNVTNNNLNCVKKQNIRKDIRKD